MYLSKKKVSKGTERRTAIQIRACDWNEAKPGPVRVLREGLRALQSRSRWIE